MKFLYLFVDLFTIAIPVIFSFNKKLQFHKEFRYFFPANMLVAVFFLLWDSLFTHLGVWGFNANYVTGIQLFNLPIEEVLFFICIPFSCVFTYHCLNLFWKIKNDKKLIHAGVILLASILLLAGIFNYDKLYTSTTFIITAVALTIIHYYFKTNWLAKLLVIYVVLLIPFSIVNGILTGTGLEEPVVWYNNAENLRIRIGTIPIEDIFYGLLLILLNVFFFERFKANNRALSKS